MTTRRAVAVLLGLLAWTTTQGGASATVLNVTDYGGALGNAKQVTDGVIAANSNQLHSATANWSSGDVGAMIWINDNSINKLLNGGAASQTTITGYTSPTQITIGLNAWRASNAYCEVTWGHDDTGGFTGAFGASSTGDTVYMRGGHYMVTSRFAYINGSGAFSLKGESAANTFIYPSPDFTIPGDGSPAYMLVNGADGEFSGFKIIGPDYLYTMSSTAQNLITFQNSNVKVDFRVTRVGANASGLNSAAVYFNGATVSGTLSIFHAGGELDQNSGDYMTALRFHGASGTFTNIGLSNFMRNAVFDACVARQGVGQFGTGGVGLTFIGGVIDENFGPASVQIINGSLVNFIGMTIWANNDATNGGAPGYAVSVDGTSSAYLTDDDLGGYFIGDAKTKALSIAPGGRAHSVGTTFRAASLTSNVSVDNYGDFYDDGGNDAYNSGTGAMVPVLWDSAFLKRPLQPRISP